MRYHHHAGYIGITTILIVSVITLAIAVGAALLGINELLYSYNGVESAKALHAADGCADEAIHRLKADNAYTGGTIPHASGSCTVIVSGSGSTRAISANVTVGEFTRSVQINVSLLSNTSANAYGIDVTAWSE
jgi:hypothetical protein